MSEHLKIIAPSSVNVPPPRPNEVVVDLPPDYNAGEIIHWLALELEWLGYYVQWPKEPIR